ncbi:MAG: hypothetical protein CMH57_14525 [Myxococcales bacterium]|nr:hypothetical protein [Myxococcales bacterium]
MERGVAGLSRRQFLTLAGLALGGAACSPGPYASPILRQESAPLPPMRARGVEERDVSAYLPSHLTGRYFFGGGWMGRQGVEPQSVLVELDANRGVIRRSTYTYDIDEGRPLTSIAGADAVELLEVVRRIAGRIHKVAPVPERDELYLFPVSGAPAVVNASSLELTSSFGERAFFADNFCAHPHYEPEEQALYYTRMDVLGNLTPSLDGTPERYRHTLMRRDLRTGAEKPLIQELEGAIVHEVTRSPDGRVGVIVFTGDGIRAPFGRAGDRAQIARKGKLTAKHSRLLLFDWAQMRPFADIPSAAVPVHVAFEAVNDAGRCEHLFVQCVNTTFVDNPPGWYGTGAYQKINLIEGTAGIVQEYTNPTFCNVPHSLRMSDKGDMLLSTNAESRCILALDPRSMERIGSVPFEPMPGSHDQAPRGIEQSVDGRYLIISSNTSLHFFDLVKRAWVGRPIGVTIGERHAHTSRSA